MKLIARMHQCLEARGDQSISSSTDANGRGQICILSPPTVRKRERENGRVKRAEKKGGLKYLRHSHFVSVAGPGEDAIWGWVIDSACSLSIRGESGDGTRTQRKRKIMGRCTRYTRWCHKSGRTNRVPSRVNHVLYAKPELHLMYIRIYTYMLVSMYFEARRIFSLNVFLSLFRAREDLSSRVISIYHVNLLD